jgi:hypothetical protein
MATPAVNPVTAGKKIANTTSKGKLFVALQIAGSEGVTSCVKNPTAMEARDNAIAPIIKNWVLMATEVPINAIKKRMITVAVPRIL